MIRPTPACGLLVFVGILGSALAGVDTQSGPIFSDQDRDGLDDGFEQSLLLRFVPTFHISANDCAGLPAEFAPDSVRPVPLAVNGTVYGQVFRNGEHVEIHYYHLWNKDCGNRGHALDAEHVAGLLSAADETAPPAHWKALYWFAAAHQTTLCELSSASSASALNAEETGPQVWVSEGKHASFLTSELCGHGCGADSCAITKPLRPSDIVNIGEPGRPMNGAIWVNSSAWPMVSKMNADFDAAKLSALDSAGSELVLFRPSPSAQNVVSAGLATAAGIEMGNRQTAAALDTAGDHTDNALDSAFRSTATSLAASRRSVVNFLSGGRRKRSTK